MKDWKEMLIESGEGLPLPDLFISDIETEYRKLLLKRKFMQPCNPKAKELDEKIKQLKKQINEC